MKELSVEQKAKAYDEALKVLHKYDGANIMFSQSLKEEMFPELKESEDERIRKAIINFLHEGNPFKNIKKETRQRWIAWLEKQGKIVDYYEDRLDECACKYFNKGYKHALEKQRKNNMGISESTKQKLEDNLNKALEKETPESWNEFLEKQGKQKNKIQPKFKIGDIIRFKGNETLKGEAETHKIVSYDNELYVFADGTTDLFCEQDLYELVEQKSTDKIEPKFYVNEWVVTDKNNLVQIKAIEDSKYVLENTMRFSVDYVDKCWRKWTIQDAKDGDVLYENDTKTILIFKSQTCGWIKVYCDFWINKNKFTGTDLADYGRVSEMNLKPATKEQRGQLEKAMADAGYTFDFGKKELKKIEQLPIDVRTTGYWNIEDVEQKPVEWSEDEKIRKALVDVLNSDFEKDTEIHGITVGTIIAWLEKQGEQKSIDDLTQQEDMDIAVAKCFEQGEQNTSDEIGNYDYGKVLDTLMSENKTPDSWSEEDEDAIAEAIIALEDMYDPDEPERCYAGYTLTFDKAAERLKSLRPHWKPSDEQIKALKWVLQNIPYNIHKEEISGLLDQIKEL